MPNPLGAALGNTLVQSPEAPKGLSKGQIIMGIIADALAGAAGQPGPFAAQMARQRQQEQEEANWGRRFERQKQIEQQYEKTKPYRWEANDGSLMEMGPDGTARLVYKDPTPKANLDPDVFITLPNGQVYAGPRSGLAAAMMGGTTAKTAPRGKLTPVNGGPTPPASGGFPRPF